MDPIADDKTGLYSVSRRCRTGKDDPRSQILHHFVVTTIRRGTELIVLGTVRNQHPMKRVLRQSIALNQVGVRPGPDDGKARTQVALHEVPRPFLGATNLVVVGTFG